MTTNHSAMQHCNSFTGGLIKERYMYLVQTGIQLEPACEISSGHRQAVSPWSKRDKKRTWNSSTS